MRLSKIAILCLVLAPIATSSTLADGGPLGGDESRNPIVSGPHDVEGPADRYRIPYEPITHGQTIDAPLPGLAYS